MDDYNKKYYTENKKQIIEQVKIYKKGNNSDKKYYEKHKLKINTKHQEKYKELKDNEDFKQKQKEYRDHYYKNNAKLLYVKCVERRTKKLNRTPKWADLKAIQEFYKNCPEGYHVDHIIPLQGKNICGLHVLENLQYLLAAENLRKSNKYEI